MHNKRCPNLSGRTRITPTENLSGLFYILDSGDDDICGTVERCLSHSCRQEIAVALGDGIALTVEGHTALALKADK